MKLPVDFKEFIELMIAARVRFVMIGGYAYNLYRNPRATGDIDFWWWLTMRSTNAVYGSYLSSSGFGSTLTSDRLLEDEKVIMLGRSPLRIDILTSISGVTFEEVEATCNTYSVDGIELPVISPEMLLRNKEACRSGEGLSRCGRVTRLVGQTVILRAEPEQPIACHC